MYSVMATVRVLLIVWFIVRCLQHLRLYRKYLEELAQIGAVIHTNKIREKWII